MRQRRLALAFGIFGAIVAICATSILSNSPMGSAEVALATTTNQPPGTPPLQLTPPMGWNAWSHFQCNISENLLLSEGNALVSTGLASAGYNMAMPDDCWMQTTRDSSGNLQANPSLFPNGMAYLGNQLHSKGLKYGIYEDLGTTTCQNFAGSYGHYSQDANLFASWGVDYVKMDACNLPTGGPGTLASSSNTADQSMSAALASSGRPMAWEEATPAYVNYYETPNWWSAIQPLAQWGQLWREGQDINNYSSTNPNNNRWNSVVYNYDYNSPMTRYAKPGAYNDPDFIIGGDTGTTTDEAKSQMSLWSMMSAPLMLGADITTLSAASISILGNRDVIAIDQDPLVHQANVISQNGNSDVLFKTLSNGDRAIALFNRSGSSSTLSTTASQLGLNNATGCSYSVKDLWTGGTSISTGTFSTTVPSHGTAIFRVTPSSAGCGAITPTGQIVGNIVGPGNTTSTRCLDNYQGNTTNGNPIDSYSCIGASSQAWTEPGDGTLRIQGKCLDIPGGSTTSGTHLELYDCLANDPAQQWTVNDDGTIRNPNSSLCATIGTAQNPSSTGYLIEADTCGTNRGNQVWATPGNTAPSGAVIGVGSTLCLDNSGSVTTDGNPIDVYTCRGTINQKWTQSSDGTVRVQGKCLETPAIAAGTYVVLASCNGSVGQQWSYADGGGLLKNPNSGMCLDVHGGSYTPGALVDIWYCNTTTNQLWRLPL